METVQSSDLVEEYSWPMYRHDSGHTGYTASPAPNTNYTAWKFKTGGQVTSSPTIAYGKVFVGSWDGYLYALDEDTGTLIWSHRTEGRVGPSAVVSDRIFVVSDPPFIDDGVSTMSLHLYCLNVSTGEIIWKFYTDNVGAPTVADGKIFIYLQGPYQGNYILNVLNMDSGEMIWSTRAFGGIASVSDGKVFFSDFSGYLVSLNSSDGTLLWNNTSVVYTGSVIVGDNRVFAFHHKLLPSGYVSDTTYFSSFNKTTGILIWEREIQGFWIPAIAYSKVFVRASDDFGNNFLYALNETNGAEIWKYKLEASGDPSVSNGKVFVSSGDSIYVLSGGTGTLLWTYKTGGELYQAPAIANGRVFVGSGDGYVYAIGPRVSDKIKIVEGGVNQNSINMGETGTVWFKAINEYDDVPFDGGKGILYVNGSAMAWSTINNRWEYNYTSNTQGLRIFKVTGVFNNQCNETIINDVIGALSITWWLPTILTISLTPSATYVGFKIQINGKLLYPNGTGVSEANLLLAYSVTSGNTWIDITSVTTALDGGYSAVWMPTATGNYLVRVSWEGRSALWVLGAITYASLTATPLGQEYVFSVTSNSTVSNLAFNSTSRTLSFVVSGSPGTKGYVNATIAKTLIGNINELIVFLNGTQTNYIFITADDAWIIYFTYQHSTYNVIISLGPLPSAKPPFAIPMEIVAICGVIVAGAIVVSFALKRKGKILAKDSSKKDVNLGLKRS